jgi:hypothetical protein
MSAAPIPSDLETVPVGEPTIFDSHARLVPEDLQTAYYRLLAHTRTLSPDDEMLRIARSDRHSGAAHVSYTGHTPKDIADGRERFQELLELHWRFSDEAQQKKLGLVRELEARISDLPRGIKAGLDPHPIAKMLGESLRQHFLQSGMPDTAKALQTTSSAMTNAQKELSIALHNLSDSHGGVVAQVQYANNRLEYSLVSRAKSIDALLHEWKRDLLRIWIPLTAGTPMFIGLFGGIEIQGCRDWAPTAAATPTQSAVPSVPNAKPQANHAPAGNLRLRRESREKATIDARHER